MPLLVGEGEQVTPLPLEVLGDLRLATEVSQESGRFTVRLSSNTSATALGGLLALELSGRGSVSGPIPASIRLSDLNTEFFRNLLSSGEGEGALRGRLSLAGLPSRLDANFQLHAGRLTGSASLVSVAGVGRGTFQYSLDQGFSARAGLLGLTRLVIAPADERPESERHLGPFGEYDFGSQVFGLGATGVSISPGATQILSLGAGPQIVGEPEGATRDILGTVRLPGIDRQVGLYGGVSYTLITDFDRLFGGRRRRR